MAEDPERTLSVREETEDVRNAAREQKTHF